MSTSAQNNSEVKQHFAKLFELYESNLNGRKKLLAHAYRKTAIDRLAELSFPTRRTEDWKYTSVARLLQPSYQLGLPFQMEKETLDQYSIPGLESIKLVFSNGVFNADLSDLESELPNGVVLCKLDEALAREDLKELAEAHFKPDAEEDTNPFTAINTAFSRHGFFIHVPKGVVVDKPFEFIYLTHSDEKIPVFSAPRMIVVAETSSEVSVIERYHAIGDDTVSEPYFTNTVNRIAVGANARVHHYKIQEESLNAFQVTNTEVRQHRDSIYSSYVTDLGGKIIRNNLSILLKDSNTETNMYGIYLPKGDQHIDNQTFVDHAHPHCNSNELYKGIINDRGRGVFNGKVLVRQDAQKTNAFQQNSSLVLSKKGTMDSKPQLEIFADDVKCSHGATIGQLDEAAVYYLKARGLNDSKARALLQYAFIGEVIEKIPIDSIKQYVEGVVQNKLND